ncbi:MAG TPA: response regulator [Oligoflexus sp.]|uniref:response regulator n=1 Tax=Oligoflexus sp. TaxID=1971216 RepID=UPI002D7F217A|nr:response regulator [Oligoflexus sp.]HET9240034.1 response regulator [Oligoflexus sp.]
MSQLKVLVIDDEIEIANVLREALEELKWQVVSVHDGETALRRIKAESFDVIISDVCMPEVNGVQLLRTLSESKLEAIMVLMSGFASIPLWEAYDLGAQAFFGKPFPCSDLIEAVHRLRTPLSERWSKPLADDLNLSGHIQVDERSPLGKFSLGRGGIFIACTAHDFARGKLVSFSVKAQNLSLEGIGKILWTRGANHARLLPGVGLEFLYLEPPCRDIIIKAIKSSKEKAYIPRGNISESA